MSLQYKAYLLNKKHHGHRRDDNVKEIRRFTIDTDVTSSYDYLKNKVASVFPDIGTSFTLHYKDTEEDMISFSSDEELLQALGQINDGIFRLYIKVKGEMKKDKNEKCKRRGQFPFGGFGFGEYPHEDFGGLFGHPTPPPHGHPPPPPHHGHHPPPPHHGHPPPPPHGHHPPPPPHGHPLPPGAWAGFGMAPNAWGFGPWGHPGAQPKTQTQAQTGGEKQTSSSSEEDGTQQQHQSQTSASATATAYLNSVGEAVAGFLKPLGIDVDIDVEHNGQRSKCSESENKKKQREEQEKEEEQPAAPEDTTPKSTEVPTSQASAPPPTEPDWTVVQDQEDTDMSPVTPNPEVMNVDPPIIINPRLNDALTQMLGMGFTNDGGWLTHLLEAHEYDIPRALDAMQPSGGSRA